MSIERRRNPDRRIPRLGVAMALVGYAWFVTGILISDVPFFARVMLVGGITAFIGVVLFLTSDDVIVEEAQE